MKRQLHHVSGLRFLFTPIDSSLSFRVKVFRPQPKRFRRFLFMALSMAQQFLAVCVRKRVVPSVNRSLFPSESFDLSTQSVPIANLGCFRRVGDTHPDFLQ